MGLKHSDILFIGTPVNFKYKFWKDFEPAIVAHIDKWEETYTFIRWKNTTKKHAVKLTEIYIGNMDINQSNGSLNVTYSIAHNGTHTIYREDQDPRNKQSFEKYETMLNSPLPKP